jgi:hypothetical protein
MENAVGAAPADRPGDAVMVLSCWVDGAPGGFVARVTMSGAGHEASVRTLSKREQVHAVVDEWLDELLGDRRAAKPRA